MRAGCGGSENTEPKIHFMTPAQKTMSNPQGAQRGWITGNRLWGSIVSGGKLRVDKFFLTLLSSVSTKNSVNGVAVFVERRTSERWLDASTKIQRAVSLIEETDGVFFQRLLRLTRGVIAMPMRGEIGRWCGGFCLIDAGFAQNAEVEEVAGAIVHEVTHAKIERWGIGYGEGGRRRVELACTRAVDRFAGRLRDCRGKDLVFSQSQDIYRRERSYWSNEELTRQRMASSGGNLVSRTFWNMLSSHYSKKAERERCIEGGHLLGAKAKLEVLGGFIDEDGEGIVSYAVLVRGTSEIRTAWIGWFSRNHDGGWDEVTADAENPQVSVSGGQLSSSGYAEAGRGLVPVENVFEGVMACCLAIDEQGRSYYVEAMADPTKMPSKWEQLRDWVEPSGAGEGERELLGGLEIGLEVAGDEVFTRIPESRALLRQLRRDYQAKQLYGYSIEVINKTPEEARIFWMQSYQPRGEGGWRGINLLGRPLGGADFTRWFGGDRGENEGWIEINGVARCNFAWDLQGGPRKWVYLAVGRSGALYLGRGDVCLSTPISLNF